MPEHGPHLKSLTLLRGVRREMLLSGVIMTAATFTPPKHLLVRWERGT
jgi:hypothetical protein